MAEKIDENQFKADIVLGLEAEGFENAQQLMMNMLRYEQSMGRGIDDLIAKYGDVNGVLKHLIATYKEKGNIASSILSKEEKEVERLKSKYSTLGKGIKTISGALGKVVFPSSFLAAGKTLEGYSQDLLETAANVNRLGIGLSTLENSLIKVADSNSLTRQETIKMFNQFQSGMREISIQDFESVMKRMRSIVGANTQAMGRMQESLSSISQEYPSLSRGLLDLARAGGAESAAQKEALKNRVRNLYFIGKISDAQYKQLSSYLSGNKQLSSADSKRQKEMQGHIEAVQNLKKQFEYVGLAVGEAILPALLKISRMILGITKGAETFAGSLKNVGYILTGLMASRGMMAILGTRALGGASLGLRGLFSAGATRGGGMGAAALSAGGGGATPLLAGGATTTLLGGSFAPSHTVTGAFAPSPTTVTPTQTGGGGNVLMGGGSKSPRMFGTPMRKFGAGIALGAASIGLKAAEAYYDKKGNTKASGTTGLLGSAAVIGSGAMTGAALGQLLIPIPGVGAAIGGAAGAIGGFVREMGNIRKSWEKLTGKDKGKEKGEFQKHFEGMIGKEKSDVEKDRSLNDAIREGNKENIEKIKKIGVAGTFQQVAAASKKAEEDRDKAREKVDRDIASQLTSKIPDINIDLNAKNLNAEIKFALDKSKETLARAKEEFAAKQGDYGDDERAEAEKFLKTLQERVDLEEKIVSDREKDPGYQKLVTQATVLNSQLSVMEQLAQKQKDVVAAINSLYQSQSGLLDSVITKMSMTGNINADDLENNLAKSLRFLDASVISSENLIKNLQAKEADLKIKGEGATIDVKAELDKKDLEEGMRIYYESLDKAEVATIDIAAVQDEIIKAQTTIVQATQKRLEMLLKMKDIYEGQSKYLDAMASKSGLLVQLADNFAIGVGASADLRIKQFKAEEKAIEVTRRKIAANEKAMAIAHNMGEDTLALETQRLELENEILQRQITQAQQVKALRDGWISAISAMNAGFGGFSEIVMDANQNLAQMQKQTGAIRSNLSGAVAKRSGDFVEDIGYNYSERMTTRGDIYSQRYSQSHAGNLESPFVSYGDELMAQLGGVSANRATNLRSFEQGLRGQMQRALSAYTDHIVDQISGSANALGATSDIARGVFVERGMGIEEFGQRGATRGYGNEGAYGKEGVGFSMEDGLRSIPTPARKKPKGDPVLVMNKINEAVPVIIANWKDMPASVGGVASPTKKEKEEEKKQEETQKTKTSVPTVLPKKVTKEDIDTSQKFIDEKTKKLEELKKDGKEKEVKTLQEELELDRKKIEGMKKAKKITDNIDAVQEVIDKKKEDMERIKSDIIKTKEAGGEAPEKEVEVKVLQGVVDGMSKELKGLNESLSDTRRITALQVATAGHDEKYKAMLVAIAKLQEERSIEAGGAPIPKGQEAQIAKAFDEDGKRLINELAELIKKQQQREFGTTSHKQIEILSTIMVEEQNQKEMIKKKDELEKKKIEAMASASNKKKEVDAAQHYDAFVGTGSDEALRSILQKGYQERAQREVVDLIIDPKNLEGLVGPPVAYPQASPLGAAFVPRTSGAGTEIEQKMELGKVSQEIKDAMSKFVLTTREKDVKEQKKTQLEKVIERQIEDNKKLAEAGLPLNSKAQETMKNNKNEVAKLNVEIEELEKKIERNKKAVVDAGANAKKKQKAPSMEEIIVTSLSETGEVDLEGSQEELDKLNKEIDELTKQLATLGKEGSQAAIAIKKQKVALEQQVKRDNAGAKNKAKAEAAAESEAEKQREASAKVKVQERAERETKREKTLLSREGRISSEDVSTRFKDYQKENKEELEENQKLIQKAQKVRDEEEVKRLQEERKEIVARHKEERDLMNRYQKIYGQGVKQRIMVTGQTVKQSLVNIKSNFEALEESGTEQLPQPATQPRFGGGTGESNKTITQGVHVQYKKGDLKHIESKIKELNDIALGLGKESQAVQDMISKRGTGGVEEFNYGSLDELESKLAAADQSVTEADAIIDQEKRAKEVADFMQEGFDKVMAAQDSGGSKEEIDQLVDKIYHEGTEKFDAIGNLDFRDKESGESLWHDFSSVNNMADALLESLKEDERLQGLAGERGEYFNDQLKKAQETAEYLRTEFKRVSQVAISEGKKAPEYFSEETALAAEVGPNVRGEEGMKEEKVKAEEEYRREKEKLGKMEVMDARKRGKLASKEQEGWKSEIARPSSMPTGGLPGAAGILYSMMINDFMKTMELPDQKDALEPPKPQKPIKREIKSEFSERQRRKSIEEMVRNKQIESTNAEAARVFNFGQEPKIRDVTPDSIGIHLPPQATGLEFLEAERRQLTGKDPDEGRVVPEIAKVVERKDREPLNAESTSVFALDRKNVDMRSEESLIRSDALRPILSPIVTNQPPVAEAPPMPNVTNLLLDGVSVSVNVNVKDIGEVVERAGKATKDAVYEGINRMATDYGKR